MATVDSSDNLELAILDTLKWLDEPEEEFLEYSSDSYQVPTAVEVPLAAGMWDFLPGPKVQATVPTYVRQPNLDRSTNMDQLVAITEPTRVNRQLEKTRMCSFYSRGMCYFGAECRYAHSSVEIRAAPNLSKTKLCMKFKRGACFNKECTYAHGVGDLRATPGLYKTSLCTAAGTGKCRRGAFCRFAHGVEELR
eukprot:TRINITY_DN9521_c0_g1_i1.p1 TRINITY_DN9521_c0_g1~~TRINITY_DN9521_c0_g1_i1.p1  ORF type:complete len:194 (-),score=24.01 TRINITY_DN9521_c0_g1_i1:426-1007(-)